MILTDKHRGIVAKIDEAVSQILWSSRDLAPEEVDAKILSVLSLHALGFKYLIDTLKPGELNTLCEEYAGFRRFAEVLEMTAKGVDVSRSLPANEN